jgi:hypothetical protein
LLGAFITDNRAVVNTLIVLHNLKLDRWRFLRHNDYADCVDIIFIGMVTHKFAHKYLAHCALNVFTTETGAANAPLDHPKADPHEGLGIEKALKDTTSSFAIRKYYHLSHSARHERSPDHICARRSITYRTEVVYCYLSDFPLACAAFFALLLACLRAF